MWLNPTDSKLGKRSFGADNCRFVRPLTSRELHRGEKAETPRRINKRVWRQVKPVYWKLELNLSPSILFRLLLFFIYLFIFFTTFFDMFSSTVKMSFIHIILTAVFQFYTFFRIIHVGTRLINYLFVNVTCFSVGLIFFHPFRTIFPLLFRNFSSSLIWCFFEPFIFIL